MAPDGRPSRRATLRRSRYRVAQSTSSAGSEPARSNATRLRLGSTVTAEPAFGFGGQGEPRLLGGGRPLPGRRPARSPERAQLTVVARRGRSRAASASRAACGRLGEVALGLGSAGGAAVYGLRRRRTVLRRRRSRCDPSATAAAWRCARSARALRRASRRRRLGPAARRRRRRAPAARRRCGRGRPVVADDDDDARPVVEEVLERAQRVEVEVVGRLVEQQHVRLLARASAAAAAGVARRRSACRSARTGHRRRTRTAASASTSLERRLALVAGDRLAHPLGQVEVAAELVVVADLHRGAALDRAASGCSRPAMRSSSVVLPAPFGADDAEPVARFERQRARVAAPASPSGHANPTLVQLDRPSNRAAAIPATGQLAVASRAPRRDPRPARSPRRSAPSASSSGRRTAAQPGELASGEVRAHLLGGLGLLLAVGATGEVRGVADPACQPAGTCRYAAPRSSSSTRVVTRSSTWRSWVTSTSPPRYAASHSSRNAIASRSRWLVGSSRISASYSPTSSRASATRLAWPPDSSSVGASSSVAHARAVEHRLALPRRRRRRRGPCPAAARGSCRARRPAHHVPSGPRRPRARARRRASAAACVLPLPLMPDDAEAITVGDGQRDIGEQRPVRPAWRRGVRRR